MDFKLRNFDLPENMFYFHNTDGKPLSFLLDYDTNDNFYAKLLKRYYANVDSNINDHTMVLSMHSESKYFNECVPAFDIKFIEDCFTLKEYPDPTKYLIQNSYSSHYTKNDIFNCWFYHKKSWFDLSNPQNINDNKNSKIDNKSKNTNQQCTASTSLIFPSPNAKRTRLPYCHSEDKQIVQYIIKHGYAFEIYGTRIWQKMERANVCKIRTWQSMKERFIKYIKYDLISGSNKYPFISPEDLKLLRQGLKIELMKDRDREKIKSRFYEQYSDEYSDNSS